MRTVGLLLVLACCFGCKGNGDAAASTDPAALKAQQELISRREALMAQRKKLEGERDKLDEEIKQVTAKGGDASELAKKRAALDTEIQTQSSDLSSISTKIDQVVAQGDAAAGMAGRESSMAARETRVASREAQFAERERSLAAREAALAQREKETCGAGAGTTTIVQVPMPKSGGSYSRRDIDPLLQRARTAMQRKGLLQSDLGPAANLESEAMAAVKNDELGKAYLAAAQLSATVEAIKIDRNFISAKTARLQAVVRSSKRDEATQQQLAKGLEEVMQRFGDGDFAQANKKLNQLWGVIGK
jgi:hypothetical protein